MSQHPPGHVGLALYLLVYKASEEITSATTRLKSSAFISRLFAIQIAAEPLYNTPLVHWTLCLLPHYGALA